MDKTQILVVDDEQGIRDIIKAYLISEDFEVIEYICIKVVMHKSEKALVIEYTRGRRLFFWNVVQHGRTLDC